MASGLAAYLRTEIDRRGWSQGQLADRAGIPRSVLSSIMTKPERIPTLETLDHLAQALDISLATLITVCGFSLRPPSERAHDEQLTLLLETVPELRAFADSLTRLPPEDVRAIQAYVDGYVARSRQRHASQSRDVTGERRPEA